MMTASDSVCRRVPNQRAPAVAFLLAIASVAVAAEPEGSSLDALRGGWCAELSYNGQSTSMALHVPLEGDLMVTADVPRMDAYGMRIGTLAASEVGVQIGPWPLSWDAASERLSGDLPSYLVPKVRIPAVFERCEPPARSEVDWSYPGARIAWSAQTDGPVWAGLALDRAANRLVVASVTGSVVAYDAASGEESWRWRAPGAVRARPAVIGDAIYVTSDDGKLSRLSRLSGGLVWQADIGTGPERLGSDDPESKWDKYASSVVEQNERLFVGSRDGALYALNPENGSRLWRYQTEDVVQATPAVAGDRVFVASFDGTVTALNASNGEPTWRHDTGFPVPADLAVVDGKVLAGSRSYELLALSVGDGDPDWTRYFWFSWVDSTPNIVDGVAYIGSSDGLRVSALSGRTGEAFWETRVPGWSWAEPAVSSSAVFTGTVGSTDYVGSRAGSFVGLDRSTGEIRWLFPQAPPEKGQWGFAASAVATDELVYAADLSGKVYAFSVSSP